MTRRVRRLGLQAVLWAAPLGAVMALFALVAGTPFFLSGPGVPSAGDPRGWTVIWGALGLVAGGCAIGLVATTTWLARSWRRTHRPTLLEWFRSAVNLVCAGLFLWLWLG